jgi:serine/threonine protein kinase
MSAARKTGNGNTPVFGRYQPIALLGEGSVARVYLAVTRGPVGWGNLLVIKEIRPELASQPQFREMFLHEARMALGLHHPNIVQTYEIFEERAPYVVAMEFLDGQTLADLLRRVGRADMPLGLHLWILHQVLAGLHHAHEIRDADGKPLRIVHRDVNPANVFLTYEGQVKLVDFGIAKFTGMVHKPDGSVATGKLGYGAPEQFVSQPIDPRSDVYSVGVMLWEALAGRRRRVSENRSAVVDARIAGQEPRIADVLPDVPPVLAEICDRATAPDRRARYQSALEMQQALESYLDGCWEPVDRRELSEMLDRNFTMERASIRRCIERQLSTTGLGLRPLGVLPRRSRLTDARLLAQKLWARVRMAILSATPVLRTYGPAALVAVATTMLVTLVWLMTSRSSAALRAAERAPRAPAVAARAPGGAPPAPAVKPSPSPARLPAPSTERLAPPEQPPAPPPVPSEPARSRQLAQGPPEEAEAAPEEEGPRAREGREMRPADKEGRPARRNRLPGRLRNVTDWDRLARPEVRWNVEPGEELPPPDRLPRRPLDEGDPYAP